MNKRESPSPDIRKYTHDGAEIVLEPLAYFRDVLDLPDLVASLIASPAQAMGNIDIYRAAKGEIRALICQCAGLKIAEFQNLPMELQATIVADFMEVNLTENFIRALCRVARQGRQIISAFPRPSSPPVTDGETSSATPAGKSRDS